MFDMDRRSLFMTSAAAALTAAATTKAQAEVAKTAGGYAVNPRGVDGIKRRLPSLDLESFQQFLAGQHVWMNRSLVKAADARAKDIFKEKGIPLDANLPFAQLAEMFSNDPILSLTGKNFFEGQHYKFTTLRNEFHRNADAYYDEMEANDKVGPGTLELNPKMFIPTYAKLEIHNQIGGFCGDPFAGYIYHYGVLYFSDGRSDQDEIHTGYAASMPVPKDGKVKRILDLGTGMGQLATALHKRFPEAEVWGVDVGGPMIRYGHVRANALGAKVNFRQALAEDTKFPDNHFDIITSYLMHHEATADASKDIFKEVNRILRPGGVYYPIDAYTQSGPPTDPYGKYRLWWIYRWNHEDWQVEWSELDARDAMRKANLKVTDGPVVRGREAAPNYMGIKA